MLLKISIGMLYRYSNRIHHIPVFFKPFGSNPRRKSCVKIVNFLGSLRGLLPYYNNPACKKGETALCAAKNPLSFLESAITPLLGLMPAMKLGLSNLVVMYALLFLNTRTAAELVLLKALFALLTRGLTAGFLSLCGGVLSFLVLWGLLHLPASPGEFIFTVSGALAHNIGQLLGASVLLSSAMALGYAPVLLVAGLCVGALSCVLSKAL